uniref:Alternative protein RYR1 n=1 Tax=Homo sapiens TaxID=9606 RepID=L8E9F3_HUMAN|nr:alternative protein RYR1 [Homo sapiens]
MVNSSSCPHLAMLHAMRLCSLESDSILNPSRSIDGRGPGGLTWWAPVAASHTPTSCPALWTLSRLSCRPIWSAFGRSWRRTSTSSGR